MAVIEIPVAWHPDHELSTALQDIAEQTIAAIQQVIDEASDS